MTRSRAKGLTQEIKDGFYNGFEKKLVELNIKDKRSRIFNLDEVGLSTAGKKKEYFFRRGAREAHILTPNEGKSMFTVLFCCSAAGDMMPPFTVYKGTPDCLQSTWVTGGPPGSAYSATSSGWMEDYVLENWLKTRFIRWLNENDIAKPVILLFDGHGSHITYKMAQTAKENGICLFCLPPHTSSKLQPLDVSVYAPLKVFWKDILTTYYRESRLTTASKAVFPFLLKQLYEKVQQRPGNIVNGFAACGICPFNKNAIPDSKLIPSTQFEPCQESENEEEATASVNSMDDVVEGASFSPRKVLRKALISAISPPQSKLTENALINAKKPRRRVQKDIGECLTEEQTMERLKEEEERRQLKKKCKAGQAKRGKPKGPRKSMTKTRLLVEDVYSSEDDLLRDEEDLMFDEPPLDGQNTTSTSTNATNPIMAIDIAKNLTNKYVAAKYDDKWYLGVIEGQNFAEKELDIKFMHPNGPSSAYTWPIYEDRCTLPLKEIIGILRENPKPTNARASQFSIGRNSSAKIELLFQSRS